MSDLNRVTILLDNEQEDVFKKLLWEKYHQERSPINIVEDTEMVRVLEDILSQLGEEV